MELCASFVLLSSTSMLEVDLVAMVLTPSFV